MGLFRSVANAGESRSSRTHPSNNDHWLTQGGTYSSDRSATPVNEENALANSAVWSAVLQLGSSVGALPLELLKKIGKGKVEIQEDHPLYFLMHLMPNPEMTTMLFREAMTTQMLLYGACYAEKQFDGNGNIVALWPLLSKSMRIIRRNGVLFYKYTPGNKQNIQNETPEPALLLIPRERILHIPYLTQNGLAHYSPIEETKEAIALALALEDYASLFFKNNAKPAAVIEIPGGLSPKAAANFKASWNEQTEGLSNVHRTAILEEGIKLHEYGSTPRNSQSIEQREFQLDEVARIFNMPPHMLKNLKRATFSNIEEQVREFVMFSLNQLVTRMEENYTVQLLTEKEYRSGKMYFKHDMKRLLRGNTKDRWEAYAQGFNMGVYSPNAILELEDMNTYEGGDDRYVQLNMQRVSDFEDAHKLTMAQGEAQVEATKNGSENNEGSDDKDSDKDKEDKENKSDRSAETKLELRQVHSNIDSTLNGLRSNWNQMFKIAFDRITNAEVKALTRKLDLLDERNNLSYMEFVEDFYNTKLSSMIRNIMFPVFETFMRSVSFNIGSVLGTTVDMTQHADDFIRKFMNDFVLFYTDKSIAELRALISGVPAGESVGKTVSDRLNEWQEKKAKKNTRRWRSQSLNAIATVKYRDDGFTRYRWRTVGDNCPFCNGLNNTTVGIEGRFVEGNTVLSGEEKQKDGTTKTRYMTIKRFRSHPPLHDGCDCVVVPEMG